MRNFFSNISVTIKELFESFLEMSRVKKLLILGAIVLAVAAVFTGIHLSKEAKQPERDPDWVAQNYAESFINHDYLQAYEYSIIGKTGVEKYLDKNYFDGYKHKDSLTEMEEIDARNLADTLDASLDSFLSTYGIQDYDGFFGAYFDSAAQLVTTFLEDTELSDRLMVRTLELGLAANKEAYVAKLNEQYKYNYEIKLSEPTVTDFTEDEVEQYVANKSDTAKEIFAKTGLNPEKIKDFKRYDFNVMINDEQQDVLTLYLVKIGGDWYVDLTTLVY